MYAARVIEPPHRLQHEWVVPSVVWFVYVSLRFFGGQTWWLPSLAPAFSSVMATPQSTSSLNIIHNRIAKSSIIFYWAHQFNLALLTQLRLFFFFFLYSLWYAGMWWSWPQRLLIMPCSHKDEQEQYHLWDQTASLRRVHQAKVVCSDV